MPASHPRSQMPNQYDTHSTAVRHPFGHSAWRGRNINRLSFSSGFRHCLRAASPSDDYRCGGILGFAGGRFFIGLAITHASILSSVRSTGPRGSRFNAHGMLSYHSALSAEFASSVLCLAPVNFRRHRPRIVSCYTLFKGWLPLSQPPICCSTMTTFYTEQKFRDLRLRSGLFPS